MQFKDKVIVITGSSKGLGFLLAEKFIQDGAQVVLSSRGKESFENAASSLGSMGILCDVSKEDDVENLATEVVSKFGRIDIWINNAGIWIPESRIEDISIDRIKDMFEVNVFGLMYGSQYALKQMLTQKQGTIINIISTSALDGKALISGYSSSKWAAAGFTKALRAENRETNITIHAIYPGGMKTHLFDENPPRDYKDYMEPETIVEKIMENLKKEVPEEELILKRPTVKSFKNIVL